MYDTTISDLCNCLRPKRLTLNTRKYPEPISLWLAEVLLWCVGSVTLRHIWGLYALMMWVGMSCARGSVCRTYCERQRFQWGHQRVVVVILELEVVWVTILRDGNAVRCGVWYLATAHIYPYRSGGKCVGDEHCWSLGRVENLSIFIRACLIYALDIVLKFAIYVHIVTGGHIRHEWL